MGFNRNEFSIITYSGSFTIWSYFTHKDENLLEDNYFEEMASVLKENDLILAVFDKDFEDASYFKVTSVEDGKVVVEED